MIGLHCLKWHPSVFYLTHSLSLSLSIVTGFSHTALISTISMVKAALGTFSLHNLHDMSSTKNDTDSLGSRVSLPLSVCLCFLSLHTSSRGCFSLSHTHIQLTRSHLPTITHTRNPVIIGDKHMSASSEMYLAWSTVLLSALLICVMHCSRCSSFHCCLKPSRLEDLTSCVNCNDDCKVALCLPSVWETCECFSQNGFEICVFVWLTSITCKTVCEKKNIYAFSILYTRSFAATTAKSYGMHSEKNK